MEQLGVNLTGILAQIVNFSILFFILNKMVFKAILEIVDKERKKKAETEKYRQKIEKEWQEIEKRKGREMAKAKKEAGEIISQAKQKADKQRKEIIVQAKSDVRETLKEAAREIKSQERKMKAEAREFSANLAVKMASKLMAEFLDKGKQRLLVKKSILSLKKTKTL